MMTKAPGGVGSKRINGRGVGRAGCAVDETDRKSNGVNKLTIEKKKKKMGGPDWE